MSDQHEYPRWWPKPWRPTPGECLDGQVVSYQTGLTGFGVVEVVVILDDLSGNEVAVWLLPTQLRKLFHQLRPARGSRVRIVYRGLFPFKLRGGRAGRCHQYSVEVLEWAPGSPRAMAGAR